MWGLGGTLTSDSNISEKWSMSRELYLRDDVTEGLGMVLGKGAFVRALYDALDMDL